ncbi:MAG: outer membrane protein assembly factor BamD [Myxococcaceae bacterium]
MRPLLFVSILMSSMSSGCAFFAGPEGVEPSYASEADENVRRGQAALASRSFPQARKYFEHVRAKHPFLDAAIEAELGLADADFGNDQFAEARERYTAFVKLHPSHSKVPYAAYRAALTFYKELPSDFFILPPSYEKEQTEVKGAERAFDAFVRDYPKSEYLAEIKTLAIEVRLRLARHELYAADFYDLRGKLPAVAGRLQTLVDKYPGTVLEPSALLRLANVYERLEKREQAKGALQRLVDLHAGTSEAQRARELLARASP